MTIRVNGDIIPDEAIMYELSRLVQFYSEHMSEAEVRKQMDALKARARDQAIGAKLLIEEADRLDIQVADAVVDESLRQLMKSAGGREQFKELVRKQGLTEDLVRRNIRRGKRVDLLVEKITEGVSDPTEEEMLEHFREHVDEYREPDRAEAQHILMRLDADSGGPGDGARARLEDLRKEIERGAGFEDMAAAHSDCPSGKASGGNLGWFSRGMMVPEFDEAVFAMEVGELSGIVETPLGYHLIRKTGAEDGVPADYDDVRDRIREFLRHVKRGAAVSAHVNELKAKARIEGD